MTLVLEDCEAQQVFAFRKVTSINTCTLLHFLQLVLCISTGLRSEEILRSYVLLKLMALLHSSMASIVKPSRAVYYKIFHHFGVVILKRATNQGLLYTDGFKKTGTKHSSNTLLRFVPVFLKQMLVWQRAIFRTF